MSVQSPSRRARHLFAAAVVPLLAFGCAQPQPETESPMLLEEKEAEVAKLRRENAALKMEVQNLEERVRMIEHSGSTSLGTTGTGTGYESYSVAPVPSDDWQQPDEGPRQLPVVKLTPNERSIENHPAGAGAQRTAAPKHAPAATGRRASVSLTPSPGAGGMDDYADDTYVDARGGAGAYADESDPGGLVPAYADPNAPAGEPASYRLVGSRLVSATQRKPAPSGRPSDRDSGVVKDYKSAMAVYRDGRYAEAEQAFAGIVAAHPNHDYADNALYWQGEAAYDQAHYADALAAFTKVVERYGGGNKAPDALLKIGLCYGRLGDADNARDVLTQLVAAYPRAEASKIAKRKLADLD